MDTRTFDALARATAGLSRRRALGLLAAALAGALAAPRRVAALPTGCFYYVLSGGPALNDPIEIDDDLTVSLNGTPLLEDVDGVTNILEPIVFQAAPGDELTVTARDAQGPCRKIGALWLHCAIGGDPVRLTTGQDDGCDPARPVPDVFFTQTWVIGA